MGGGISSSALCARARVLGRVHYFARGMFTSHALCLADSLWVWIVLSSSLSARAPVLGLCLAGSPMGVGSFEQSSVCAYASVRALPSRPPYGCGQF